MCECNFITCGTYKIVTKFDGACELCHITKNVRHSDWRAYVKCSRDADSFGDDGVCLRPLLGVKIVSVFVQTSRRVYPLSSTVFILACITVNENSTKLSRYAAAKSYLVSLNCVTFVFTPTHQNV
jgi:hypothetical protein